ncbi:MAG: thioredoxin family protein [Terracidiphilus sp.]|jgi:thiol:disulfide interchange protein DsbD
MRRFWPIFALVALFVWTLPASAQLSAPASSPKDTKAAFDAPHLRVELLVPGDNLYSGDALNEAGLHFKLESGWHIYWENAGDSGEPPHIQWTLPKGISAAPMQFPAPKRLPLGPLMDFGYENEVLFPFTFHVEDSVKAGPVVLRAKVDWLVCREVCIPGKAELQVTRDVYRGLYDLGLIHPPIFAQFLSQIPKSIPAADSAVFQPTPTGFRLAVSTGQRETQAEFFPEDENIIDNPAPQTMTPVKNGLVLDLKKDPNLTTSPVQLNGVLELSGGRNYEIAATREVSFGVAGMEPMPAVAQRFSLRALARIAALAFLGGLLLNLMPCVFPVLFLKGLALCQSGAEERHKLRAHGFVYTIGILVSFWVLVAALLALRVAGATLGWGFQFQSPVFLSLMAALLFFLGLSLAGQFEVGLTLASAGGSLAAKQGYAGSFFTGVLAVVVATPCTAPFMGAAIGYALAQSAAVTFAVFTALALGLAAPYFALTLQPAWTRLLPRPGAWMDILKQAVSVPIFVTVIWLAWVVAQAYGAALLAALLASFLLLAIAGWFLGRRPAQRWATTVAAFFLVVVAGICVATPKELATASKPAVSATGQASATATWQPWSAEAVQHALAAGQPVFVDFTASWCLTCQVNERVALDQPRVTRAFAAANVALFRADWTLQDPAITEALAALGRSGVPVYALYTPGQATPQLLPQVLTPGIVLDAVTKLPTSATQATDGSSKQK